MKGVGKLGNLRDTESPLFQSIFGASWNKLPPIMRRHYANRAYRDDVVTVAGSLTIHLSFIARLLKPVFRWTATLVPYEGKDVPVTVDFVTATGSSAFRFERRFEFPGRAPYFFRSTMLPLVGNEVVEMMGCGLGWRAAYLWDGAKVILAHRGYVLRLFGMLIPIPLTLLMGRGYAEEHPISDDSFSMWTETRHPVWGRVFGYAGVFTVTKDR
jgi:hypothetical protein